LSPFFRIYLIRGLVAIAWAISFAAVSNSLTVLSAALLVAYPLIDVIASLLDSRETPGTPARMLQVWNTALSALAALGLGVAAARGIGPVLLVFGTWAIVSGTAQFTVAIRRHSTELGRQWPMLIAGALSVVAGASYLLTALGDAPVLTMLIVYTAAGGVFFILQAASLAFRLRRRSGTA
jgi:uncharacterized membrane protein HdeD (DUF308 family)